MPSAKRSPSTRIDLGLLNSKDGSHGKRRHSSHNTFLHDQIILLRKELEVEREKNLPVTVEERQETPVGLDNVQLKPLYFVCDGKSNDRKLSVTNPTNRNVLVNWNYRRQGSKPKMVPAQTTRELLISKNALNYAQEDGFLQILIEACPTGKKLVFPLPRFESITPIDVETMGTGSYKISVTNRVMTDLRVNSCPGVTLEKHVTRKDGFHVVSGKTTVYNVYTTKPVKNLLYFKAASQGKKWQYKIRTPVDETDN